MYSYDDLYLAHHGIKGQKWGVRRYQNADGSLTSVGKRRVKMIDTRMKVYRKYGEYEHKRSEKHSNIEKSLRKSRNPVTILRKQVHEEISLDTETRELAMVYRAQRYSKRKIDSWNKRGIKLEDLSTEIGKDFVQRKLNDSEWRRARRKVL